MASTNKTGNAAEQVHSHSHLLDLLDTSLFQRPTVDRLEEGRATVTVSLGLRGHG